MRPTMSRRVAKLIRNASPMGMTTMPASLMLSSPLNNTMSPTTSMIAPNANVTVCVSVLPRRTVLDA